MPLADNNPQLKQGQKAERQFLENYSPWLMRANSEDSNDENWGDVDFRVIGTNLGVELKCDFYERPVNMYLERWTTERRDDPAGPWKARDQGAEFFSYWYASLGRLFIFRTQELIEHIEDLPAEKKREVKSHPSLNDGYRSVGILVRIEHVDYVAIHVEDLRFER